MALAHIYRVVADVEGNVVTGVLGTVTLSGTSTLASLFADAAGTLPLPNPTTNNAQYGSFALFVAAGTYDMQFVKAGYTFETQSNITMRDPAAGVNTITGTANRVLVSPVPGVGTVTLSTPQDIAPDSAVQFGKLGINTPAPTQVGGLQTTGPVGFGRAIDPGFGLSVQGSIQTAQALFVQSNATLQGIVGIERAPLTGYSLATLGAIQAGSALEVMTTLAVAGQSTLTGPVGLGRAVDPSYGLSVQGAIQTAASLYVGTTSQFSGVVGIGQASEAGQPLTILYNKNSQSGLKVRQSVNDAGGGYAVNFINVAGASIGSITTTAAATAYNTSSDTRLKHAIAPLTGALDVLAALRPVRFRWNADDSVGHGFLAHELQQVIADAVTGLPDEVNPDGSVKPQQVDHSKLLPWLTAALQEAVAQGQALRTRLQALEEQLGI